LNLEGSLFPFQFKPLDIDKEGNVTISIPPSETSKKLVISRPGGYENIPKVKALPEKAVGVEECIQMLEAAQETLFQREIFSAVRQNYFFHFAQWFLLALQGWNEE